MTDWLFFDHWSSDSQSSFAASLTAAVVLVLVLVVTWWRRRQKGFRGFDFTAVATAHWMASLAIWLGAQAYRIAWVAEHPGVRAGQNPTWYLLIKWWFVVATVTWGAAVLLDKRVYLPEAPANVTYRRRKDDFS